jgi:4-hydroxy-tetrahydrodipicolinate synthase
MSHIFSLKGIITPIVTPLKDTDELDLRGLEQLIEHIIQGGVSGVFVLGTTGEFSGLSYRLRAELVEHVCHQVNGRIKVLIGITDTAFTESINMANKAFESGADAVVAAPPYYYPSGQPELIEYFERMLRQLKLPLFLYNMPVHTKTILDPETVMAIAEDERVVGLKDSSANMVYFRSMQYALRDRDNFLTFIGPEEILADAVVLGASGGVNGGSNLFPRLYVDLYNAASEKNFERIINLQQKVLQISSLIYSVGRFGSSYLKGLKCALSLMGICDDYMSEPFHRFKKEERDKIAESLKVIQKDLKQIN